jgi:hypothetical protein
MQRLAAIFAFSAIAAMTFADDAIQGIEQLHQEILLVGTTNAPVGASGVATLQAENEAGLVSAGVAVEVKGLAPGRYVVSVTRKSDGHELALGRFSVGFSSNNTESVEHPTAEDQFIVQFGTDHGLPLPAGLAVMDIAALTVSDANRHAILTGNLAEASETTKALFKAKVSVSGSTGATGTATIRTRTRQGFKTERFKLDVSGVTPNAKLALKINGENFGTVTTNDRGKLRLKSLPEGVEPELIELIEFAEPDGTNALTISF